MKKLLFILLIFCITFSPIAYADDDLNFENYNDFPISETGTNSSILEPNISSKNAIIFDRNSKITLYEKNSFQEVAIASTTKIMTCILALENADLSDTITISKKAAAVTGSTLGLKENMKFTLNDLLYGLMLRSGNDCAIAIAEHISGSTENFSILMNKKAKELNLKNTNFITPHGLDNENHYSSAYDLALLTDYALNNNVFKKIVSTKRITINFNGYPKELINTNELLGTQKRNIWCKNWFYI